MSFQCATAQVSQNPMENPVVLSIIFDHLPVSELKKVRLVSKLWLKTSLPTWRKRAVIELRGDRNLVEYLKSGGESESESGKVTLSFQSVVVNVYNAVEDDWWLHVDVRRFWKACGPHITNLTVGISKSNDNINHVGHLRAVLLGPETPNLKSITLKLKFSNSNYKFYGGKIWKANPPEFQVASKSALKSLTIIYDQADQWLKRNQNEGNANYGLPFSWEEIFTYYPNLEKLEMECFTSSPTERTSASMLAVPLKALKEGTEQGLVKKFNSLSLREKIEDEGTLRNLLRELTQTKINLKFLKLHFRRLADFHDARDQFRIPNVGRGYYQLLELHKDTLLTLDVCGVTTKSGVFPLGTTFPKLENLIINPKQCGTLGFLRSTPVLKSLHVLSEVKHLDAYPLGELREFSLYRPFRDAPTTSSKWINHWFKTKHNLSLTCCNTLNELVFHKECSPGEIEYISKCLPNVEILTMPMNDYAFGIVCQKWNKLRHLTVLQCKEGLTNAGITGMTEDFSSDDFWGNFDDTPEPKAKPNVKDLKDLQSFKMVHSHQPQNVWLTSSSLSDGFLHLPFLSHLEIVANLDDASLQSLFEHVPRCVVFFDGFRCKRTNIRKE